ncbi:hypothetical protein ISN75_12405 [Dyella marensis]|uniref:hypothetical protein n=1 Tax=Dyella marensis TaxID=500610 RepID=UPI0031E1843B
MKRMHSKALHDAWPLAGSIYGKSDGDHPARFRFGASCAAAEGLLAEHLRRIQWNAWPELRPMSAGHAP